MGRFTLTCVGYVWAALSIVTAIAASVAFYLPYWIRGSLQESGGHGQIQGAGYGQDGQGQEADGKDGPSEWDTVDTYFGSFRRCNYPRVADVTTGAIIVIRECGRYTRFADIPSLSWQISTVAVGLACSLTLLVGFTAVLACCIDDVVTKRSAKVAGIVQLISALLIMVGCAIFPNGWHIPEVREACGGKSDAFVLGTCTISWSFYGLGACVVSIFLCVILSFKASRIKCRSYRT